MMEVDTLPPNDWDEQFEKFNEALRHVGEQITLVIENWRGLIDILLYDSVPKYIRTELKFPKKKKRGTMRRQRRERKVNEID